MAATAAIAGNLDDVRKYQNWYAKI
jgi:hypothetical protein